MGVSGPKQPKLQEHQELLPKHLHFRRLQEKTWLKRALATSFSVTALPYDKWNLRKSVPGYTVSPMQRLSS